MSGETARHILVVDDDDRLRRLLQRYLTEHGYHVTTAADADEAKAALKNFAFDMMVLDVMLPGQDGISLTGELRAPVRPADPAADRARRERRSGQRSVRRRRRLPGQAVRSARAAAQDRDHPAPRGAAAAQPRSRCASARSPSIPRRQILWRGEQRVHLTDAELSLLQVLAEQPGLPVSRQELGRRSRVSGSDRAIDTQIARLRRKLEPDPRRPHHLLTKRGEGYVLKPGS